MSANNTLRIFKEEDGKFRAYDECIEVGSTCGRSVFVAETVEEAVKKAQDYMCEEVVEFGYRFVNL